MEDIKGKHQQLKEKGEARRLRAYSRREGDFSDFYGIIGNKVLAARRKMNITQQELADALGMQRTSIANIELGNQHVPIHKLYAIAELLGVEPKSLLPDSLDDYLF
jgi:DNA-binding XRE family transcriptional regulator